MHNLLKQLLLGATTLCCISATASGIHDAKHASTSGSEMILHAWTWSFDTIAANMHDIAAAGYTYVQTSPAQACYIGDDGGMALYSTPEDSIKGKWYYYYQPTDWSIGNYMLGDRNSFKAMCDSAYKYGVRVLVDVLPNHTAIDHHAVLPTLDAAVGGHDKLYHANGFNEITDYNDRYQCTTGQMGGLPDVNTENPDFQYYYLQYVNDLINLGARGFRYDTAKHIGLPSDPLDAKSTCNDFWDIATGRKAVKGLSLLMPDSLYIYGEVLQDRNTKETEYAEYIDQTASSYGHILRQALANGSAKGIDLVHWCHPVNAQHLVTWVESHDTYCNEHISAALTNDQIRMGWVILTARASGRPLFYSRPEGSSTTNVWGKNRIGARGNDQFRHPEVVAVNNFRKAMSGQPETITTSNDGAIVHIARGTRGIAIVNISDKNKKVKIQTSLPDGTYTDAVHGCTFKVSKGILSGKADSLTSYLFTAK